VRRVVAPLAIVAGLVGAWELAARWDLLDDALGIEPFLVPAPSDIAEALWEDRELLAEDGWVTLKEVVLGFALAVCAGALFAIPLHLSAMLRTALYPLLVASRSSP
jgi:ABC-type nitrate/sulfonate/bicarbonate transport system permease component